MIAHKIRHQLVWSEFESIGYLQKKLSGEFHIRWNIAIRITLESRPKQHLRLYTSQPTCTILSTKHFIFHFVLFQIGVDTSVVKLRLPTRNKPCYQIRGGNIKIYSEWSKLDRTTRTAYSPQRKCNKPNMNRKGGNIIQWNIQKYISMWEFYNLLGHVHSLMMIF